MIADKTTHLRIAIIGAGPAGSMAAGELAQLGHTVRLYDMHRGAWEKPCGGGVTAKALRQYPFLHQVETAYPRQTITEMELVSPRGRSLCLQLETEFVIFARQTLNACLLERACAAGVAFIPERATALAPAGDGWRITTPATTWEADFLVGADGCTSFTRRQVAEKLPDEDQAMCCGYYLPAAGTTRAVIAFPPDFTGYVWAFPRVDHISYGIINACDEYPLTRLWEILDAFVRQHSGTGLPQEKSKYAARVPMLRRESWKTIRNGAKNWALVGDAAGLVDPITGEGIYYALRSAELLAQAFRAGTPELYEQLWRSEFEADLSESSRRLQRFYRGRIFGGPVLERMFQVARFHGGVGEILSQALAGDIDHVTLKPRLVKSLFNPRTWFGAK
ncbi:MAG: NAD(P)/FAD-dependent oxidoreductase [Blastocatellia bacterium]|nr:NAD(P)/FAD-dependent oxidoreductase [Blastocatellia bacterium]